MIEDLDFDPWEARWIELAPIYQIEFWSTPGGPGSMWHADVTRLKEASSVEDVLTWARAQAEGRQFTIYAEVNRGTDRGRVRLFGTDPTRPD